MPAALVEGLHEQSPRPLPFRVLCHDRLQAGHGVLGQSQRQDKLGPAFPRRHPELVEPDSLGPRERPVRELGQSGAPPQAQRLVENRQTLFPRR